MRITKSKDIYNLMKGILPKKGKKTIVSAGVGIIGLDSQQDVEFIEFTGYTAEKFNQNNNPSVWEPYKTTCFKKVRIMILVETRLGINHDPTRDDRWFSKRQFDMGKLFSVYILDHLIMLDKSYYSMADNGILGI